MNWNPFPGEPEHWDCWCVEDHGIEYHIDIADRETARIAVRANWDDLETINQMLHGNWKTEFEFNDPKLARLVRQANNFFDLHEDVQRTTGRTHPHPGAQATAQTRHPLMGTPINKRMCATCPWNPRSPYQHLREQLEERARGHESRLCHSTGSNAINENTGIPERLCRGARNSQLEFLHALGFLSAPTDAAWTQKCREMGIEQDRKTCSKERAKINEKKLK